jgi:ATP-dependent RNA helicase DDX6/DHH1
MNNNNRGRYPPGIGAGRGGGMSANPNFQSRVPQQQYVQRHFGQNHHQQQYNQHQQNHNQQQQQQQQQQQHQQQQWLRRSQLAAADSSVDEVEKTVQSEAVDSRLAFIQMDKFFFKWFMLFCPNKYLYVA